MTHTINADTDLDVPVDIAYQRWARFEDLPQFMGSVESVRRLDESTYHWTMSVGGVHREFDAQVVELVPNEVIAWTSRGGEQHSGRVTFAPRAQGGSHIDLTLEWEPQDLTEKAGAALQIDDLQAATDLRRFKHLVEKDTAP